MKKIFLISFSIFCIFNVQSQISSGIIAKYYFNNGNANDDKGKYHGKVNGAVLTMDRFGNQNKAFQFGQNQTITIPDSDSLDGMINQFSISFWLSSSANLNSNTNSLISKFSYCGGGSDAYNIYISSTNSLVSQINDEFGLDAYQFGKKVIADNKWHHVVVIWDKPNFKFYIDTIIDSFSRYDLFNSTVSNSNEVLAFGQPIYNNCPYSYNYNEKLDDIRIYNRALTKKEVDTLFNEPNPCKQTVTTINQTIKPGSSYFFKGQNLTTTGIYRDTLKNSIGCDSFIILNLTAFSSISSLETLIRIYPNPSSGIVNFLGLQMPTVIEIFSIDGKRLRRYITKESINISELKPGTYLLKIDGKTYKIILNK